MDHLVLNNPSTQLENSYFNRKTKKSAISQLEDICIVDAAAALTNGLQRINLTPILKPLVQDHAVRMRCGAG